MGETHAAQTGNDRPGATGRGSFPRWMLIIAAVVAVIAIISYFVVGDREEVVTTDMLPQQIGPQGETAPVTTPTPATPAPPPEPATPAQPPTPVQ